MSYGYRQAAHGLNNMQIRSNALRGRLQAGIEQRDREKIERVLAEAVEERMHSLAADARAALESLESIA